VALAAEVPAVFNSHHPAPVGNAQLEAWRVLRKIRCCPRRVTDLVKAILVFIHAR
jgi:hypothetical protein